MSFFDEIETVNSTIDIEDQQGVPMGWQIEVRPPSDPHVRAVENASQQKQWEAARKGKNVASVQHESQARKLAAHIANWTFSDKPQITTADGHTLKIKPKEYSESAALELMKDANMAFVAEQVAEEINNASNFYKA